MVCCPRCDRTAVVSVVRVIVLCGFAVGPRVLCCCHRAAVVSVVRGIVLCWTAFSAWHCPVGLLLVRGIVLCWTAFSA